MLQPCYVPSGPDKGHWVHVPTRPIEVDDEVAAPLVEDGSLEPYRPGGAPKGVGAYHTNVTAAVDRANEATSEAREAALSVAEQELRLKELRESAAVQPDDVNSATGRPVRGPRRSRRSISED